MKLELIYTFNGGKQLISTSPINLLVLSSKKSFIEYILSFLTDKEVDDLAKISCCVKTDKDIRLPQWLEINNGKFYF